MTPTTEGKQLAADLANAVHSGAGGSSDYFTPESMCINRHGSAAEALARLATEHLALKAQLEEALADLREIDRGKGGSGPHMPLDPATLKQLADWLDDAGQNIGAAKASGLTGHLAGWEARLCAYVATKLRTTATIAAKYRVETDPLVEALEALEPGWKRSADYADRLRAELSKRGYEIGRKS